MTEFEDYFSRLYDGRINACEKMKRISEILLERFAVPDEFHFDYDIAMNHVEFIERFCKRPSGKLNTPLELQLFQKARFQAIFGFVDDNNLRQYNEVLIMEGRKNGKTTECAAVELDLLINDDEGSPQIYNVATKKEQANLGFNAVHKMIKQSPLLSQYVKKRAADLYCAMNLGFIKAVASNTNSLDGLDAHGAIIDELAAIKNRDLYDLIKQSMSARDQPLLFTITTNGFIRNGVFDAQYDYADKLLKGTLTEPNKRFLPLLYELDSVEEWDDESCWIKANPGLGTIKNLSYLRDAVKKAKDDPTYKATVIVKDFCIKQTAQNIWLSWEKLNNEEINESKYKYCLGAFDAADSVDLNAAIAICQRPDDPKIYVKSMFWIPEKVLREAERKGDRKERDGVPYSFWVEQGYMRTCPGNKCDKKIFLDWFIELRDKEDLYTLFIFYDPWHVSEELIRQFQAEFGKNSMIPVRQGVLSLSQPMKDLEAEFEAHNIVYDNNPVLKWNLANMVAKTDINGNIQPVKTMDPRLRIDGGVSLIMAYKGLTEKGDSYINLND
ncbi:MAG: terminase large subunit [Clostridia bacterium]|nr:terminase large subunit [Clostridia bacterium]